MEGLSLSALEAERAELVKDYFAFVGAYDLLHRRTMESAEVERQPPLHQWSGTVAPMAALDLAINAIRRTIEGHDELISKVQDGQIENLDVKKPHLTLVEGP